MDPRLTPFNGRVAHVALRGKVEAENFVEGEGTEIAVPVADLSPEPGGRRVRQLLLGEGFLVLERRAAEGGWAFGQSARDGHVGWLPEAALSQPGQPTHWVAAPGTHLYAEADIKSPDRAALSLGARLRVDGTRGALVRTPSGWVPSVHLRPLGDWAVDVVAVAAGLIGTPYLWGGNSRAGLDCSGLVQAAFLAGGHVCPPDSDLQMALGRRLAEEEPLMRGDLVFWKGHVGLMEDAGTLLHANTHHMAVAREPLAIAEARIGAGGSGPIIARRRLAWGTITRRAG